MLALVAVPLVGGGHVNGISLVGSPQSGSLPTLLFAPSASDPALAYQVTAGGDSLEVARGGGAPIVELSPGRTQLPHVSVAGDLSVASLGVNGHKQWAHWDLDTFDAVDSGQWSPNDHTFCGAPHDMFLGGHCRFAASTASRRYKALPSHTKVRVKARVHFLDQWHGESVLLMINGKPVWSQSHSWCPGFLKWMCAKYGVDTCGRDTPDRLSVKVEAIVPHSGPTLDVAFTSNLAHGTDACYTSWGVDDVSVDLM